MKKTKDSSKLDNYFEVSKRKSSTTIGSLLGTSTVTTFVESGTGIGAGGKTGLTALTTSILFLLSIFLLPLFAFIPSASAASALIYVGVLMMKNVINVDFENSKNSIPVFMTIITMVLAYSITDGIGVGVVTFVILDVIIYLIDMIRYKLGKCDKPKLETTFITLVVLILFLIYFLVPVL